MYKKAHHVMGFFNFGILELTSSKFFRLWALTREENWTKFYPDTVTDKGENQP